MLGVVGGASQPHPADPAYVWVFLVCMALTGVLCVWQARLGERQREELAELSRTDPLTGCLNRRGFSERLDAELRRGRRGRAHPARPQRLQGGQRPARARGRRRAAALGRLDAQGAAARLGRHGRLGGDEFALLLPGVSADEARAVAARTVAALAERIGAAAGVACHPADGGDGDELHRHADADLYAVKAHLRS